MLSARSAAALDVATANLALHLERHPDLSLDDVAFTLQAGRRAFEYRRAVLCRDLDEGAAKGTIYGGLIASGWLTVAIMMRLLWDTLLKDAVSLGSPGADEVRWLKPVRPGDTLRARFTVVEAIPSRSKPDRGVLRTFTEILNQHGEIVMTLRGLGMFGRRPR